MRVIEYVVKFLPFYGWNLMAYPKADAKFEGFVEQITDKNIQIRDRGRKKYPRLTWREVL